MFDICVYFICPVFGKYGEGEEKEFEKEGEMVRWRGGERFDILIIEVLDRKDIYR